MLHPLKSRERKLQPCRRERDAIEHLHSPQQHRAQSIVLLAEHVDILGIA